MNGLSQKKKTYRWGEEGGSEQGNSKKNVEISGAKKRNLQGDQEKIMLHEHWI